jgi:hypothetical protein
MTPALFDNDLNGDLNCIDYDDDTKQAMVAHYTHLTIYFRCLRQNSSNYLCSYGVCCLS